MCTRQTHSARHTICTQQTKVEANQTQCKTNAQAHTKTKRASEWTASAVVIAPFRSASETFSSVMRNGITLARFSLLLLSDDYHSVRAERSARIFIDFNCHGDFLL